MQAQAQHQYMHECNMREQSTRALPALPLYTRKHCTAVSTKVLANTCKTGVVWQVLLCMLKAPPESFQMMYA